MDMLHWQYDKEFCKIESQDPLRMVKSEAFMLANLSLNVVHVKSLRTSLPKTPKSAPSQGFNIHLPACVHFLLLPPPSPPPLPVPLRNRRVSVRDVEVNLMKEKVG